MFSASNSDSFPSFLDHPVKSSPLSLDHDSSSESPNKNYCEDIISLNQINGIVYADMDTEKQYEQFSKALQKVAASLPTEDHWELMKKKIKKPKKLKVTRSSRVCRICCLGFRPNTIVHRFECLHICHEDCTLFFERKSSKCPFCTAGKGQKKETS